MSWEKEEREREREREGESENWENEDFGVGEDDDDGDDIYLYRQGEKNSRATLKNFKCINFLLGIFFNFVFFEVLWIFSFDQS
jgi:hypothetical protein